MTMRRDSAAFRMASTLSINFRSSPPAGRQSSVAPSGGYISVVTKSGTNLRAWRRVRLFPRRQPECDECAAPSIRDGKKPPMSQKQYGGSIGGPLARNRSFYFTNLEQRRLDQTGLTTVSQAERQRHQREAAGGWISRVADLDRRSIRIPSTRRTFSRRWIISSRSRDQFSVRYSLYDVLSLQLARRRRVERAKRVFEPGQHRSIDRLRQHADALRQNGERNARAVRLQRSQSAADRSGRARSEHRRRRIVRNAVGEPAGPSEQDVPTRQQPVAPGGCARAARWASTSSTTPTRSRFRGRFAARTRFHHSRISSREPTTRLVSRRRLARPSSRRRTRTSGSTFKTSGRRIRR